MIKVFFYRLLLGIMLLLSPQEGMAATQDDPVDAIIAMTVVLQDVEEELRAMRDKMIEKFQTQGKLSPDDPLLHERDELEHNVIAPLRQQLSKLESFPTKTHP